MRLERSVVPPSVSCSLDVPLRLPPLSTYVLSCPNRSRRSIQPVGRRDEVRRGVRRTRRCSPTRSSLHSTGLAWGELRVGGGARGKGTGRVHDGPAGTSWSCMQGSQPIKPRAGLRCPAPHSSRGRLRHLVDLPAAFRRFDSSDSRQGNLHPYKSDLRVEIVASCGTRPLERRTGAP